MTDRLNSDIDALLGEPGAADPAALERCAQLAVRLAAGLEVAAPTHEPSKSHAALWAALLDGGLSGDERQVRLESLVSSPAERAELDSAAALLQAVESAPRPLPAALRQRALQVLEGTGKNPPPHRVPWWRLQWLAARHGQIAFGVTCALIVSVIIFNSNRMGPSPGGRENLAANAGKAATARTDAFLPGSPAPEWHATQQPNAAKQGDASLGSPATVEGTQAAAPLAGGWAAIALSPSTRAVGTATQQNSSAAAQAAALAHCAEQGATDCAAQLSAQGQCLAVASRRGEVPVVNATDPRLLRALDKAFAACENLPGVAKCTVIASACGKE
jgi:hypothetical protein